MQGAGAAGIRSTANPHAQACPTSSEARESGMTARHGYTRLLAGATAALLGIGLAAGGV